MSARRIHVRIAPSGEITVEAVGFKGKGCEAATKAIEEALGITVSRTSKPEFWRQSQCNRNEQQLGEGDSNP